MAKIPLKRRKVDEGEMDITPMIDCTFLLLIYFLLTSTMSPASSVPLPAAKHGAKAVQEECVIITVAQGPDGTGQIFLADDSDTKHLAAGSPEDQDKAIRDYLKTEVSKLSALGTPRNNVLIKAAGGLKHREVARVAKVVASSEEELGSLYVGVNEQQ